MQNRVKTLCLSLVAAAGLLAAVPAIAQTYYPTYGTSYVAPSYPAYSYPGYGNGCPNLTYNLTLGSSDRYTGGQVSMLQSFLRTRYNDSRLTGGYYGSLTAYYVTRFQQESGVYPATGGVGPMTRAAIARACGGNTPGYPTYPNPSQSSITFRLDRNFTLREGQTGRLSNGGLEIMLSDTDSRGDEVRLTVGEACRQGTYCFYYPNRSITLEEGETEEFQGYDIELVSVSSSNRAVLRVEDADDRDDDNDNDNDGRIEMTSPDSGDDFDQGDEMDIEWEATSEPNDASVVLELYDRDNDRVGTIAIVDANEEEFEWDVPEGGDVCTQQFPNGLCGHDLDGEYYIKATLKEDNNGQGDTLDTDTSERFNIND